MSKSIATLIAVASIGATAIAGCGSSSSSTSSNSSATTSTPAAATTPTASTPSTVSIPASEQAAVQQAVASCKQSVAAAPTLSASVKTKLDSICDEAGKGDIASAKKAAQEVCVEIVNGSPIPAGSMKDQAIAACKKQ